MKKLLMIALAALVWAPQASAKITLPKATEFKLDNGLVVKVVERHQLPLFSMELTFRAGSICDPAGKEGLASLSSDMFMRGTASRTARQIAEEVAFGGGTLENSCDRDAAGFSGQFLTAQGEKAFEIVSDLLRKSTFTAEEFDKTKTRTLGNLEGRREDPGNVANDAIWDAILGQSPYAHYSGGTAVSVGTLTQKDVVDFAKGHWTPDNALLVVCGDVTAASVKNWAKKYLGSWSGKAVSAPASAPFGAVAGKEVVVYDKKDATQTQIRIGLIGIPLGHADYPALEVARTIYGGSFTSRLMDEIRVNRGLTYSVSYRSANLKPGGVVFVGTSTKNASVGEVLEIVLAEAQRMQTEPVSDTDLVHGSNYRGGTYPLNFETNGDLAGVFSNQWLNGLDKSYFEDYQEKLKTVTASQAMDVAKKYFPQSAYKLVLVGKADDIVEQVKKFGTVKVVPFSE